MPITKMDIEATREFYCNALGIAVGPRPPMNFSGYNGMSVEINIPSHSYA